jgi:hypothetical protein
MNYLDVFKINNPHFGQHGIRSNSDLKAYTCLHREQPIITITPFKLSKNQTEQWLKTDIQLHPSMHCVYFLTRSNPIPTPEATYKQFTIHSNYSFPPPLHLNDQQLAQLIYLSLEEFQKQFKYLCTILKSLSNIKQSTTHVRLLLRLMIEWSFFVQSRYTDRRIGWVCCADTISYINHSCQPNCFIACNPKDDWCVEVYALRDIRAGEEITICFAL